MENPTAKNTILELGGPEHLSPLDAVKIFEEVSGRKFEVQKIPENALQSQMDGASNPMQKSFSGMMLCMVNGVSINMEKVLQDFPVRLTFVREYAQGVVTSS